MADGYLTLEQAAERFRINEKQLRTKARLGHVPAYKFPGSRLWLFKAAELDRCLVGNGYVPKPRRR
jgi:excisionase family DNA binding protein